MAPATPNLNRINASEMKAPTILRCAAFMIDYATAIIFPIVFLLIGRILGYDGAKLLGSGTTIIGIFLAVGSAFGNLVLLPFYNCQSIGKWLTGISIVTSDGKTPTIGALALRHTVGYLATLLTLGFGFLLPSGSGTGSALHDRISKTVVIYARKTVRGARA